MRLPEHQPHSTRSSRPARAPRCSHPRDAHPWERRRPRRHGFSRCGRMRFPAPEPHSTRSSQPVHHDEAWRARRGLRGDVGGRESGDSHWVNGEDGGYGEIGRRGRRRSQDKISGHPPAVPAWDPSIHAYDAGMGPDFSVGWAQLPMGVLTPTPDPRPDEPTWPHRPSWLPGPRPTCRSPRRR